jgi:hypothetical protein
LSRPEDEGKDVLEGFLNEMSRDGQLEEIISEAKMAINEYNYCEEGIMKNSQDGINENLDPNHKLVNNNISAIMNSTPDNVRKTGDNSDPN